MGKQKYLIDSNPLIEFAGNKLPENANKSLSTIIDEEFNISFISRIEILGYVSVSNELVSFVNRAVSYNIDEGIIAKTIELRRNNRIKVPDAIIAATALCNNFILITRNIKDFKKVKRLELFNLYDL